MKERMKGGESMGRRKGRKGKRDAGVGQLGRRKEEER